MLLGCLAGFRWDKTTNWFVKANGSEQGWSGLLALGALGLVGLAVMAVYSFPKQASNLSNYILFWDGTMLGVWLAAGSRLVKMQFGELLAPNADQFKIWVRLVRAGLYSLLLGLLLSWGPVIDILG